MYIKVKVPRNKVPSVEAVGFKLYLLKSTFYNSLKDQLLEDRKNGLFDALEKSQEEMADYIRCMCMTQNVDPQVLQYMPDAPAKEINEYIADPMTATTFSDRKTSGGNEILTNEIIYWQMITLGIPVEFQKWHLNRLLTLIKVCSIKNNPNKKKMSRSEIIQRNRELNRARRAANHSAG